VLLFTICRSHRRRAHRGIWLSQSPRGQTGWVSPPLVHRIDHARTLCELIGFASGLAGH
jgi:hypothetical protein